ncbi:MAG: alpha/beta hydrolase, partial [Pseudomonadota bacterium]
QKGITITHETIEAAGHFFDPGMEELMEMTTTYVKRRLTENTR